MKKILITLGILLTGIGFAQDQIDMTAANDGLQVPAGGTCNGFIIDSGGQGGPGYSDNENVTVTVCPTAGSGEIISAQFNLFDLANSAACNTGTAQNPIYDYMTIYDGDNTGATSLGTYTGNDLLGVVIQATNLNPTGCLTFQFTSNSTCTGQFSASVQCATPCANPYADGIIVNGDAIDSIAACVGEVINFQEQGSFAQPGFNIVDYLWDFRDGSTANGQNVAHSYDQPGEYKVLLFVTDDNTNTPDGMPCQNLNLTELQVLVAPPPTFDGFPSDTTLCIGENIDLTATPAVWPVTWSGFPGTNSVDDGCLSDTLLGVAQTIPLFQGGFAPGSTIDDINDLESICLDMEHSYMGDLVIQIKCPNGSIVTLHQQGGGGTQIGEPVQTDDVDCINGTQQGVPYTYCWDLTATETWVEWVNNQGGWGLTLPAGNYEPVDPLDGLLGCPMNGVWELIVTDNWAADDGTVFGFGLNFDPSLYPPVTTFTPQIGNLSDSSFWNPGGAFITNTTPDGNTINVEPTADGTFNYTFSVTDDFGCTNDSTITITVNPPIVVDAGVDTTVCNGQPVVIGPVSPQCNNDGGPQVICYGNNENNLTFTYCPDNPGDGITFMTFEIISGGVEGFFDDFTVYDGNSTAAPVLAGPLDGDLSGMSWTATNASGCITIAINSDGSVSCQSGSTQYEINADVYCGGATGITYNWTPNDGSLDNVNILNPTATLTGAQTYTLTAYPTGHPLCSVTDQITVTMSADGDAGTDGTLSVCHDGAPVDLFNSLGGSPDAGGVWYDPNGNLIAMPYDPSTYSPGIYTYEVDNNGCVVSATVTVTEVEITTDITSLDADCGTACNGEITLTSSGGQGLYQFSSDNGGSWVANNVFSNLCPGGYTIIVQDDLGCYDTVTRAISEINQPAITSIVPTNITCNGADDGQIVITGDNLVNYSVDAGANTQPNGTFQNLAPGLYLVQVDNGFGCIVNANVTLNEPDPLTMEYIVNDTMVCPGGAVWLTGSAQGGSSDYVYEWTQDGVVIGNTKDLSVNPTPIGGATYCLTVSELCGSTPADTCMEVTNHPEIYPSTLGSPLTGCYPVETTFQNTSGGSAGEIAQVSWNFGDGTSGTSFGTGSISHSYNEPGVYDVSMNVTSVFGCKYDTMYSNYIEAYDYPLANFTNNPNSPTMFNANSTFEDLSSPDVVAWQWDFGATQKPATSNAQNPGEVVYPDGEFGTYPATLIVTNANGCTDTITYDIVVQSEVLVYAPNAFTPDGDQYNEDWKVFIEGIDIYDFDLFIYNRWGEIVWESHDPDAAWDGKYGGKFVQDGTYVWIVRTKDLENDEKYTFKGTVTILR